MRVGSPKLRAQARTRLRRQPDRMAARDAAIRKLQARPDHSPIPPSLLPMDQDQRANEQGDCEASADELPNGGGGSSGGCAGLGEARLATASANAMHSFPIDVRTEFALWPRESGLAIPVALLPCAYPTHAARPAAVATALDDAVRAAARTPKAVQQLHGFDGCVGYTFGVVGTTAALRLAIVIRVDWVIALYAKWTRCAAVSAGKRMLAQPATRLRRAVEARSALDAFRRARSTICRIAGGAKFALADTTLGRIRP